MIMLQPHLPMIDVAMHLKKPFTMRRYMTLTARIHVILFAKGR